ncbi:hypothetical protein AALP_AA7G255900 [Arabis alpina]|uniref:RING-type E3 ubiquitin transferase n=1 Tax=Arabis alpina TaxID=50452 RepID=A0A087GKJ5_ARAAL|nr:hypothetical protein AALP_AA7G255900 [Arabis alpina]
MTRVNCFNPHRWIIILHVALIVQSKVNAQSLSPDPIQSGQSPSRKTTVFSVIITVFFIIGFLSVYIRHCSHSNPTTNNHRIQTDSSRRNGLDDAVIETFPVFSYSTVKESKLGSNDLECAICLNDLEDRETVRLLPICNHLFHIDCIDAWLYSHATCPVCRSDLTAESEYSGEEEIRSPIRDQVVIEIIEDSVKSNNRARLSKLPRSNSTGHSIGRFSDCTERFTLRLPEDVKRRLMVVKGRRLKRARSFDGVLTAGDIGSGVKSDRVNWAGLFGSGSVKSQRSNGESLMK